MIKFCFRVDDFYLNGLRRMEMDIMDLFSELEIPLNIGVIPFDKDENLFAKAENFTKYRKWCKICLHGYQHHNLSRNQKCSEFLGEEKEVQFKKILKAKFELEKELGIEIDTFIPPWNSYDENTLKALEKCNIDFISVGYEVLNFQTDVVQIPTSMEHFYLFDKSLFRLFTNFLDGTILVLFHPYNFHQGHFTNEKKRFETNLKKLRKLLERLKNENYEFCNFNQIIVNKTNNLIIPKIYKKVYKQPLYIIKS